MLSDVTINTNRRTRECSAAILSAGGATVVFPPSAQRSPASRCCSWALPLSVQECVACITSVILPASQRSSSVQEEFGSCVCFLFFYLRRIKGIRVVFFFPFLTRSAESWFVDGEGWEFEAAHHSSPSSVWEVCERVLIPTILSEITWRD